jgi:ElaA protein
VTTPHHATGPDLTAAQLYAILRLRADVFVVEQECAYGDVDGRDLLPTTRHLWFETADGITSDPGGVSRIGRVVTAASARGQGLAASLMDAALAGATNEFVLDAQTYAQALYARFGFVPEGDEFLDDGIPHITMRRVAKDPAGS